MTYLYIILAIAAIAMVYGLISRRDSLPCPAWLGWMVEMDNPFTKYNRAATIVELLAPEKGMHILDAGCGPGRLTLPLAEAVGPKGEVTALDIQEDMLARVRQKAQTAGLENIQFLHAGLGDGKLPQNYFDQAVLVTVFGEIPDPVSALKEIYAALKPGGVLSVTEVIFDPHFHRKETVLEAAAAAGFREKAFFGKELAYSLHLKKEK